MVPGHEEIEELAQTEEAGYGAPAVPVRSNGRISYSSSRMFTYPSDAPVL